MIYSCKQAGPARVSRQSCAPQSDPLIPRRRTIYRSSDRDRCWPCRGFVLALALNELCTNAVKYGAFSNAEGHVEITSMLDEKAQRFKLIWAERAAPLSKNRQNVVLGRGLN